MESIKIVIAGKSFSIKCADQAKKELYKLAERRVNEKVGQYQERNVNGLGAEDLLSLMAFDYEVAAINTKQQNFVGSDERARMQEIEQKIDAYMNNFSNE